MQSDDEGEMLDHDVARSPVPGVLGRCDEPVRPAGQSPGVPSGLSVPVSLVGVREVPDGL